mmetsp:Transcript_26911/g.43049  ORF Transcript_26911/g.43049 Transcript_26911/m.43049 type:complete len:213 (+) Transcript_26911:854-1492(+)
MLTGSFSKIVHQICLHIVEVLEACISQMGCLVVIVKRKRCLTTDKPQILWRRTKPKRPIEHNIVRMNLIANQVTCCHHSSCSPRDGVLFRVQIKSRELLDLTFWLCKGWVRSFLFRQVPNFLRLISCVRLGFHKKSLRQWTMLACRLWMPTDRILIVPNQSLGVRDANIIQLTFKIHYAIYLLNIAIGSQLEKTINTTILWQALIVSMLFHR